MQPQGEDSSFSRGGGSASPIQLRKVSKCISVQALQSAVFCHGHFCSVALGYLPKADYTEGAHRVALSGSNGHFKGGSWGKSSGSWGSILGEDCGCLSPSLFSGVSLCTHSCPNGLLLTHVKQRSALTVGWICKTELK